MLYKYTISKSKYLSSTTHVTWGGVSFLCFYWWYYGVGGWRWQGNERGDKLLSDKGLALMFLCWVVPLKLQRPTLPAYKSTCLQAWRAVSSSTGTRWEGTNANQKFILDVFPEAQRCTVPGKTPRYFPSVHNKVILRTHLLDFTLLASVQDS